MASQPESNLSLVTVDPAQIRNEVVTTTAKADVSVQAEASELVESLTRDKVEEMAQDLQKQAAGQSELLKQPLQALSRRSQDGGEVAKTLIALKMEVEKLDPSRLSLESGWFSRMVGTIPGVGTPLKRYFSKFESAQSVIGSITQSLERGRDQLTRDNSTLGADQAKMRETAKQLSRAITLGEALDKKLQEKLGQETSEEKKNFIQEELMFPLRQRVLDLQTQLAVGQQAVVAIEIIIRNNQELIRGVNRALNVTVSALQVGVTVAMALENQKVVLDKIDSVNQTTSNLIAGTAARLKTQGVEIHQRASQTTLDLNSLKSAFNDVQTALDDISKFRQKALPQMAQSVLELDQLTNQSQKTIESMDRARIQGEQLKLESPETEKSK